MKVRFVLATLLGMAMVASELPTIAVIDIQGSPVPVEGPHRAGRHMARAQSINERVTQRITMALVHSKRFQVLDRSNLKEIIAEGIFSNGALADNSKAITLGKQLGARYVVIGFFSNKIGQSRDPKDPQGGDYIINDIKTALSISFVSTETGAISDAMEVQAEAHAEGSTLDLLMDDLSGKLEKALLQLTIQ